MNKLIKFDSLNPDIANEKVKKEFSKNIHKVIDELARKQNNNNVRNLSIINIEKILQSSVCFEENYLHSHQWLDENGWKFRIAYVKYNKTILEITLNIAKTKDKRNILYDINKIKKVEQTDGSSVKGHSQRSTFSDKNIP